MAVAVPLLLALFLGPGPAQAEPDFPTAGGFINDYVGVLDPEEEARLDEIASAVDRAGLAQIGIAIVSSVFPLDARSYAVELFRRWGVGREGRDDGVLILLAMEERRVEIEVGYGLEGLLTDAVVGRLLDLHAVDHFREGRMGQGLVELAEALAEVMEMGEAPAVPWSAEDPWDPYERHGDEMAWIVTIVMLLFVGLPVVGTAAAFLERPWMILTAVVGAIGGVILFSWLGAWIGGLLGSLGGWFTAKRPGWAAMGGYGGGGSSFGSSSGSSNSSSWSSSSGSGGSGGSGSSSSSGGSFGGGSSGGGGAGRGF